MHAESLQENTQTDVYAVKAGLHSMKQKGGQHTASQGPKLQHKRSENRTNTPSCAFAGFTFPLRLAAAGSTSTPFNWVVVCHRSTQNRAHMHNITIQSFQLFPCMQIPGWLYSIELQWGTPSAHLTMQTCAGVVACLLKAKLNLAKLLIKRKLNKCKCL
jgi:hypothetical protein